MGRSARCMTSVATIVLDYNINGINDEVHQRSADRLLYLCQLNKGTYIKVGQHVGALDMLLPKQYVKTMKVLHSSAPSSTLEEVLHVIKEDLGPIDQIFTKIDPIPIGSASLAQVHTAA